MDYPACMMSIRLQVPRVLREYCDDVPELVLPVGSVRATLEQLEREHPDLHRCVCDETGTVRRHVNLFINNEFMQCCDGLDTVLVPGDVLAIFPAVSGG